MELLIDYFRLDPVQIVSESKDTGTMKIRGIFGRAEEFNNNNRRYPKTILEREVNKLLPLVKENRLLGELDHPDNPTVKLTNASHMITNLYWQGNVLVGESQLLNTPAGKVAQQLIKDGVKIGVSSRGLGTLKPCSDAPGKFEVNEDYKAVTFDLVADPSTKGAYPTQVNESIMLEKTKKEALHNKLVMNILESKLNSMKDDRIAKLFENKLDTSKLAKNPYLKGKKTQLSSAVSSGVSKPSEINKKSKLKKGGKLKYESTQISEAKKASKSTKPTKKVPKKADPAPKGDQRPIKDAQLAAGLSRGVQARGGLKSTGKSGRSTFAALSKAVKRRSNNPEFVRQAIAALLSRK